MSSSARRTSKATEWRLSACLNLGLKLKPIQAFEKLTTDFDYISGKGPVKFFIAPAFRLLEGIQPVSKRSLRLRPPA
jgi:hypothetical protein